MLQNCVINHFFVVVPKITRHTQICRCTKNHAAHTNLQTTSSMKALALNFSLVWCLLETGRAETATGIRGNVHNEDRNLGLFGSFSGAITGLELWDTKNNKKMTTLLNGQTIVVNSIAGMSTPSFNINAISSGGGIRSVVFGHGTNPRVKREIKAPWTFCGNLGQVFNTCPALGVGTHTVTATPYASKRGTGRSGKAVTITFSIVLSAPTSPTASSPIAASPTFPVAASPISPVASPTSPVASPVMTPMAAPMSPVQSPAVPPSAPKAAPTSPTALTSPVAPTSTAAPIAADSPSAPRAAPTGKSFIVHQWRLPLPPEHRLLRCKLSFPPLSNKVRSLSRHHRRPYVGSVHCLCFPHKDTHRRYN
jgi:hypothetical protein